MTGRLVSMALLGLALVLEVGVREPMARRTAEFQAEYPRAREARRGAQSKLAALERRDAVRRRTKEALAAHAADRADPLLAVRRSMLDCLKGAPLTGVRLQVRPGRPPLAASVAVAARGSWSDAVSVTGRLAQPGSGLVLDRVHLVPDGSGVLLEVEASRLGGIS